MPPYFVKELNVIVRLPALGSGARGYEHAPCLVGQDITRGRQKEVNIRL